ncbi:MAG: hypothetical protein LBC62_11170 [Treponema sp.]|jgi:hypothetical protein|nr:hypothetical protein [Treponema sp.]
MIHGVTGNSVPNIGYAITASRSGRMSLPVASSSLIYSHFEHVSGVPAPDGTRGVAINKLKILDVLIEQLAQIKKKGDNALTLGAPVSEERLDAMIEAYKHQINQAKAASAAMPYALAPSAQTGALFSLVA